MLRLVQLNVLAPLWVGEVYKQFPCYRDIISPERMTKLCTYLLTLDADVYVLCEVDIDVLSVLKKRFVDRYSVTFTSNKKGFWSEHLEMGKVWIENGTCVLTKRSTFQAEKKGYIDLGDGCMATHVSGTFSDMNVSIVSLHFDTGPRKYLESDSMIRALRKLPKNDVCVLSGDFNMVSVDEFVEEGFVASGGLDSIHSTILEEGLIDHTLARGAKLILSKVLYGPIQPSGKSDAPVTEGIAWRMCTSPSGSDHYATVSKIML